MRALAIVDGEHYPPVVRDALAELPYEFVAAVLVGGTEKLRGEEGYGVPLAEDVDAALEHYRPEIVVDLSDEPVLGPVERFALASRVLSRGVPYVGADFRLEPPAFASFDLPSIAIVGTGKRVGKTAVTGHVARRLAEESHVVVVAMGRGGPSEPETITMPPTVEALLELSRAGRHAASDHLETAALAGVETVGCRRCGGGLAGAVFTSNVLEGARVAAGLDPDLVLFDGSGAALPPIASDRTIAVVGGHQSPAVAAGYLNAFRLLLADLVVITMAEEGSGWEPTYDAVRAVVGSGVEVVSTVLRPRPLTSVRGRKVAYFCTARSDAYGPTREHLEAEHGAEIVHISGNLANRAVLERELEEIAAEVLLVELKAAAVDVVAEFGSTHELEVVLAANDVEPLAGQPDLDEIVLEMSRIRS